MVSQLCPLSLMFNLVCWFSFNCYLDTIWNHQSRGSQLRSYLAQVGLWECLWGITLIVRWGGKTHSECGLHHVMGWTLPIGMTESSAKPKDASKQHVCVSPPPPPLLTVDIMWLAASRSCLSFPSLMDYNLELFLLYVASWQGALS